MLVHLISRPLTHVAHIPRSGVTFIADGLRAAGADVIEDVWAVPSSDVDSALTAGALELRERWAERPPTSSTPWASPRRWRRSRQAEAPPSWPPSTRVPASSPLEQELSRLVDAVIPLSRAERERWRGRGITTLSAGAFPLPMPIPDIDSCAKPAGDVISLSSDGSLDALVASMPMWAPARLVMGARLSSSRLAGLRRIADELGVSDRIDYRPGLRGAEREAMWARASVVVAGVDGSRHGGHVLEAAAHGIPSIAVAQDAHLDHVVPGTTGILVETTVDARGLGQAVASVIGDSFGVRALGISALVRVRSLHSPDLAGRRLTAMFDEVISSPASRRHATVRLRRCVGCA